MEYFGGEDIDVDADENDIFVYRGGRAPLHVTHVRIDKSVDVIEDQAFLNCENLVKVETHNGIRKVERRAFENCYSLRWLNFESAVEIGGFAFSNCNYLASVEFGDNLETVEHYAFERCTSLRHLKLPSGIVIQEGIFYRCDNITNIEFSERLEEITIEAHTFYKCYRLQRIAIPLKRDLFAYNYVRRKYCQFDHCEQLSTIELVGGIHKTVASLHTESWKTEMHEGIKVINQVLPTIPAVEKTDKIRIWMGWLINKFDRFKAEHCWYVNEATALLELALWKAALDEKEMDCAEVKAKKVEVDAESARKEKRIKCGADTVIKNVLPFLKLE
mmetsp:Transcript_14284/g.22051  ORF Transcript_14284/g.22051 Transcript_14284/m.22051 type:complete len:331 (-) Transcript_14284:114-1106(-)